MADDRRIEIEITADDEASRKLEDVADLVDDLDESVEVEVDADTRDAESRIERFERELEGLQNPDAIELRVEFRQQVIEGEIRKALRQLERLEDPVEIEIAQAGLERAQQDLKDLADLADRKYEVEVDVDPKRTAQRAAGDLDTMRERGEGFQSATSSLRGFTDELGGTAAGAGIASQAVADLGDTALILGERFGATGRLQKALTGVGSALGGLAITGVVVGGVVAGYQALQKWSQRAAEAAQEFTDSLVGQADSLEDIDSVLDDLAGRDPFLAQILGDLDEDDLADVRRQLAYFGIDLDDLGEYARRARDDAAGLWAEFLVGKGISSDLATELARIYETGDNDALLALQENGILSPEDLAIVQEVSKNYELLGSNIENADFEQAAREIASMTSNTELLNELIAQGLEWPEIYQQLATGVEEVGEATDEVRIRYGRLADAAGDELAAAARRGVQAGKSLLGEFEGVVGATRDTVNELNDELNGLDDRQRANRLLQDWQAYNDKIDEGTLSVEQQRGEWYGLQSDIAQVLTEYGNIPPQVITEVVTNLDQFSVDQVEAFLRNLERGIYIPLRPYVPGGTNTPVGGLPGTGPRSLLPEQGAQAIPSALTVNVRTDAGMRQVDRAISRWRRLNGSG